MLFRSDKLGNNAIPVAASNRNIPLLSYPLSAGDCYDDKDGQRQYEWGHYGCDRAALEQDFAARVQEYQRLYNVGVKQTEAPQKSDGLIALWIAFSLHKEKLVHFHPLARLSGRLRMQSP